MFYKIGVPKNFAEFTEKPLRWSHFLINLQVRRPDTSLKKDSSTGVSLGILRNFSKKPYLQNTSGWHSSFPTKVLSIDRTFRFSINFFLLLLIIAIMGVCSERVLKWRFFTFYNNLSKINMNVVKAICLDNNLLTHMRQNKDFPW